MCFLSNQIVIENKKGGRPVPPFFINVKRVYEILYIQLD